jgi:hypothetical protein
MGATGLEFRNVTRGLGGWRRSAPVRTGFLQQ